MNELSTIEGLPGWEALPAEERLKVRKLHAACREIAAAPNKMAAYKLAAQAMKDAGHPMSWQSVPWKNGGTTRPGKPPDTRNLSPAQHKRIIR